jgi:hypothetical protein
MPEQRLTSNERAGQVSCAAAPRGRSVTTISAEPVVARAKAMHTPIATVCLLSGEDDSTVLAHRCRDHCELLAFIDTGTALPGVREFVGEFATWIEKPLKIVEARDAYRQMVLGTGKPRTRGPSAGIPSPALGFPGPAQHGRAYIELKERSLDRLLRDIKHGHHVRVESSRPLALAGPNQLAESGGCQSRGVDRSRSATR